MLKFENIESQVDHDLQAKLHRAQDTVNEKKAEVDGLEELVRKAKSALDADRANLVQAEEAIRTAHKGSGANADAISAAMKAARETKGNITAKVQQGEERIADLSQGLSYANQELQEHERVRDRARLHVLRSLMMATKFPQRVSDKQQLTEVETVSMRDMVLAFLIAWETGPGGANPFAGEHGSPMRLFQFAAQFFKVPSQEEFEFIRHQFDFLVWGDYEPPERGVKGPLPRGTGSPINWELLGQIG